MNSIVSSYQLQSVCLQLEEILFINYLGCDSNGYINRIKKFYTKWTYTFLGQKQLQFNAFVCECWAIWCSNKLLPFNQAKWTWFILKQVNLRDIDDDANAYDNWYRLQKISTIAK